MGRLWSEQGRAWLHRFAALRGYRYRDTAGVKLYTRSGGDPPQSMLDLADTVDAAFHQERARSQVAEAAAVDCATRFLLTGPYARYGRAAVISLEQLICPDRGASTFSSRLFLPGQSQRSRALSSVRTCCRGTPKRWQNSTLPSPG